MLVTLTILSSVSSAAVVRLLNSRSGALQARLELITGAQCSIDIATYSICSDSSCNQMMGELIHARQRGVRVRVLVDGFKHDLSNHMFSRLINAGVCIREFHPLGPCPTRFPGYRNHIKLMTVDGHSLITGGRNIGDEYFAHSIGDDFVDRDILVTDCQAAASASCCFERLWSAKLSKDIVRPTALNQGRHFLGTFSSPFRRRADAHRCQNSEHCHYRSCDTLSDVPSTSICFLHSSPAVGESCHDISASLRSLIRAAKHRIVIVTPYVNLTREFRACLAVKVRGGVPVMIVTNSLRTTNQVIAHAKYVNQKRAIRRLGIDLREYTGTGTLHAKNWVVDGSVFIGSYNLNSRSQYFDAECGVIIHDSQFAVTTLRCILKHEVATSRRCRHNRLTVEDLTQSGLRPLQVLLLQPALPLISQHL